MNSLLQPRIVLFGNTVYKLKYKTKDSVDSGLLLDQPHIQLELTDITKGILQSLELHDKLIPVYNDRITIFPVTTTWTLSGTIKMYEGNEELRIYPETILLVISSISPASPQHHSATTSSTLGSTFPNNSKTVITFSGCNSCKRSRDVTSTEHSRNAKNARIEGYSYENIPLYSSVPQTCNDETTYSSWWSKILSNEQRLKYNHDKK